MDIQPNTPKGEVMGVSRSGRVRKKSSKLMDFQSPDDIDTKLKKVSGQKNSQPKSQLSPPLHIKKEPDLEIVSDNEMTHSMDTYDDNDDDDDDEEDDDDDEDGDLSPNEETSNQNNLIESSAKKSIYITEKSSKKTFMRDGKVMIYKAQRKDKGKSRYTAYMLWSKEVRQDMQYNHPELDFAAISKRLGELWANVPSGEKYSWKRRAKRLATKGKDLPSKGSIKLTASKFINKTSPMFKATARRPMARPPAMLHILPFAQTTGKISNNITPLNPKTTPGAYKITGYQPADVAAYLKLLGDSLTIIGERLKEHEGQITVSGSLSVLLDSLLCSIGPLMCLTTHIPALGNNIPNTRELLQNILDNIAYVMPGL